MPSVGEVGRALGVGHRWLSKNTADLEPPMDTASALVATSVRAPGAVGGGNLACVARRRPYTPATFSSSLPSISTSAASAALAASAAARGSDATRASRPNSSTAEATSSEPAKLKAGV